MNLRELVEGLISTGCYLDVKETARDRKLIDAIQQRDRDPSDRNSVLVDWLNSYKVLMSFSRQQRIVAADRILGFADERREGVSGLDLGTILSEFENLERRLKDVAPRTKADELRDVTSLTSKGLWCCYPDHVPIYDRNAVTALRVISRIWRLAPSPAPSEYARFLDLWIRVYREVEPAIDAADLSSCPQKVRVLDRVLWYLGETRFYGETNSPSA